MYSVIPPPPDVARWVECLWELSPGVVDAWEECVPAELRTDWIVSLGDPYRHYRAATVGEATGFHYLGVRFEPERFSHTSSNHLLGVRFRPGAPSQLFGWRGADLCERFADDDVPLVGFQGHFERVVGQVTAKARPCSTIGVPAVQNALLDPIRRAATKVRDVSIIPDVLRVIEQERCFRIRALARQVGLTERTLERRFRNELGVSPKFAARLVRVQQARRDLDRGFAAAAVARDWGFYDQPHLCSEMRELYGPRAHRELPRPSVCRIFPRQSDA